MEKEGVAKVGDHHLHNLGEPETRGEKGSEEGGAELIQCREG